MEEDTIAASTMTVHYTTEGQYLMVWKIMDQIFQDVVLEYQGKPLQGMKKFRGGLKCTEVFGLVCPEIIRTNSKVLGIQVTPKR